MARGRTHDGAHLVGRQRKDDRVRLTGRMPRLAVTVLLDLRRGSWYIGRRHTRGDRR